MKILIDECLPISLKSYIKLPANINLFTINDLGWNSTKNGKLLSLAIENNFTVFITLDTNIQYQQNISGLQIKVIFLRVKSNRIQDLIKLVPKIENTIMKIYQQTSIDKFFYLD